MTTTTNTVKDLMEFLKTLDPNTEVHCFDSETGWSNLSVTVNKTDGVVFEAE